MQTYKTGHMIGSNLRYLSYMNLLSVPVGAAFVALVIGSLLGILFTVLEQKPKLRTWIPSPTGVGIGMLVPASAVATMFAGGLLDLFWRRSHPQSAKAYVVPVASGFIAGEALAAVILPILIAAGILAP